MLNVKPLCQRDVRWANKKLGFSDLKIGTYGCTLTSLTMLINYISDKDLTPDVVNNELKKVNAFVGALVYWVKVPLAFPELKFVYRYYNYNNLIVSKYVYIDKIPVVVQVNAARIGNAAHWVIFVGDRNMIDPWDGKVKSTSTYPLTGFTIYTRS
jgi:hypothetical protein